MGTFRQERALTRLSVSPENGIMKKELKIEVIYPAWLQKTIVKSAQKNPILTRR